MPNEDLIKTLITSSIYTSDRCKTCGERRFFPLTGGIINLVFQVCNPFENCESAVLTLYPVDELHRFYQLQTIMRLIDAITDVPIQQLSHSDTYRIGDNQCGVILKEFVPGQTIAKALEKQVLTGESLGKIIAQLAMALTNIHKSQSPHFGPLHDENRNGISWEEFFLDRFEKRTQKIMSADPKTTIGNVSIHMVQQLIPKIRDHFSRNGKALKCIKIPHTLHHDLHFLNIVVDHNYDVGAILDWENATGGDPLFDLAFLEAQFFLSRHLLPDGFTPLSDFSATYESSLLCAENLQERRVLYILDCALSYFEALRSISPQDISPQIALYAENHYHILLEVCSGKALHDIGIFDLLPYREIEQKGMQ